MAIKTISYAASDIGRVRSSNQDSGYAGFNLFFVADGMGGHAGGDIASALVAQRVAQADAVYESAEKAGEVLKDTIWQANHVLRDACQEHPELSGMGTTFSGMIIVGDNGLSRKHFEIIWDGKNAAVRDLKSTNGTTVNGKKIDELAIADNTLIQAGRSDFTFRVIARTISE